MAPPLKLRMVEVTRLLDGIAILEALGEGTLLVSDQVSIPGKGYYEAARVTLKELKGKTEDEVYKLIDERLDDILRNRR